MTMRTTLVSLGAQLTDFIRTQVSEGRYNSDSDVVSAGLRLLQEHEFRLEALRRALIEGEESGPSEPFDLEAFLAERRSETRNEA